MSRATDADETQDDEDTKNGRPGRPVDSHRLLRALARGRWWLLTAAAVGSIIGLFVGKFALRHTFEASASLRYEGLPGQELLDTQRDLPSLVSITHSEPMMGQLRERMAFDGASMDTMRRLVEVEADPSSGLVTFTTTGETAEEAARMGNELAALFLDHHVERRRTELTAEIASLDQRIGAAESELRAARRMYDSFRAQNHITDLSAEQEASIAQAAELRSDADLAQAEIQALEARVRQIQGALSRTPRMEATSTGASAQSTRVREVSARLREARGSLSDEHPQVQALERQLEVLQRQGGGGGTSTRMTASSHYGELQTSLSEAEAELEATRQRHQSLEQLATQARERTNRFSTIEGQAAGFLAQVNVKEALLNELGQQKAHTMDELRDIQTGFRTVSEARPPESAIPSKKKYVVAAAIPAAFVLMILLVLVVRELRGLFVQTPAELAWWGNGPVIGSTTWPRRRRALLDLVADWDDFAPEAKGTMLVVASSEEEGELAVEIASQLNHDWSASALIDVPVIGALPAPRSVYADDAIEDDTFDTRETPMQSTDIVLASSAYQIDGPMGGDLFEDELSDAQLSTYAAAPRDLDDPAERLICTAWSGPPHGQALRRAVRLADRVLVVVTSNALHAIELLKMKGRLGRSQAVAFVLVGASDDVAQLPDRAGPIEEFWEGASVGAK